MLTKAFFCINRKRISGHAPLLLLLTALCPCNLSHGMIASCNATGKVDAFPCLTTLLTSAGARGDAQLNLPNGTYLLSQTLVIPNKMQLLGNGRGDSGLIGTVLLAAPHFSGNSLVQMGPNPGPNFGVKIENLTINCNGNVATGLSNTSSEELSYGTDLLISGCIKSGLDVEGAGAQNSGPFQNLEIYPGPASIGVTANTVCAKVIGVIAFRGIRGVTCNFDLSTHPNMGLVSDQQGYFDFVHVEQAHVGLQYGTTANSADGSSLFNAQFGPNVDIGVLITAPFNNSQNIFLFGLSCIGCQALLSDTESGNVITDNSIGWYALGNGAGGTKTILSSNYGTPQKVFGNFSTFNLSAGNGNNIPGTLSVWDSTPSGVTSVVEQNGNAQGGADLHDWRNQWGQTMASVDSGGTFHLPRFQLTPNPSSAICSDADRGTFQMVPSSTDEHDQLQICAKMPDGTYIWRTVF